MNMQGFERAAQNVIDKVDLRPLERKCVLITGANGLLGSHMLYNLLKLNRDRNAGIQIVATSRSTQSPLLNQLSEFGSFNFIPYDLASSNDKLPDPFKAAHFIIHAATYGQPKKFLNDPLATMHLNAIATERLLDITSKNDGRFLFMSSSEIYGDPGRGAGRLTEEFPGLCSPIDSRSPYTSSKRYGETLCKIKNDGGQGHARIARVSSAYGPGVHWNDDRVLNVFIRRALTEGNIRMQDSGSQRRRWLYISDAVAMLWHILLHAPELVYNVSGDAEASILEMAQEIGQQLGIEVYPSQEVKSDSHVATAPTLIEIDNQKIKKEMHLKELMPLRDGMKETISWIRGLNATE